MFSNAIDNVDVYAALQEISFDAKSIRTEGLNFCNNVAFPIPCGFIIEIDYCRKRLQPVCNDIKKIG